MSKIIISIAIVILTYAIFYVSTAFLYTELDFRLWKLTVRAAYALFAAIFSAYFVGLYWISSK